MRNPSIAKALFIQTMLGQLLSCSGAAKLGGDGSDQTPEAADFLLDTADPAPDPDASDAADVPSVPCPSGGWGEIIFEFQADDAIVSTPAIGDDGTVYFGTQSATVYAVDCFGTVKWEWPMDCGDWCPQAFEGSPAVGEDGTVYIGDDIAVPNYAFALSPEGGMLWRYETHEVYGQMDASPVIASDGTLFFGAHGDSGYVGPVGQLVALDPSGRTYEGFPMETKAIRGSPAAAGDVIYVVETGSIEGHEGPYQNAVFAATRHAGQLWRAVLSTGEMVAYVPVSSVAVDKDGRIVVVENFSDFTDAPPWCRLSIVDPVEQGVVREIELSGEANAVGSPVIGSAGFGEDIIVALTNGRLVSVNPFSGGEVFTFDVELGESCRGAPLLGDDGRIFAAADNKVFRLSLTGEADGDPNPVEVSGTVSSSLVMSREGTLYMGTDSGRIIAVGSGAGGLDSGAPWPAFRHDSRNTGNTAAVPGD